MDDALLWDCDLKEAFENVCEYINHCGKHGLVYNPKKFRFAEDVIDFAGLEIASTTIRPAPEYIC